jgi:hypothetical protein
MRYIYTNHKLMRHIKFLVFTLLISSSINLNAQYTDIINSNRPGTSQGAFAVGKNVTHIETGVSIGWEEHSLLRTKTDAFYIDYAIRHGLVWDRLEINLTGSFVAEQVVDNRSAVPFEYNRSNFRANTLGAKYLIYDPYKERDQRAPNLYSWRANNKFQWEELIPAISFYAGVNFDTEENPFLPPEDPRFSPKFVLMTQNNFEGGFVFVTNFIVDRVTTDFPTYSYILTLTHAFNPRFSMFVENQGIKSDFYADQLLRFGAAYLFGPDFQLDILSMVNFKDTPSRFFVGIGGSYRIDNHPEKAPRRN